MKRKYMSISVFLMILLLSGCGKDKPNSEDNANVVTPTAQPTVTIPAEDITEDATEDTQEDTTEVLLKIEDYYPLLADTEYTYEGVGNEYAGYSRVTDFLDEEKDRIQTRTNNGGTETVRVIEIKDGKLTVIKTLNECYYRLNLMEDATADDDAEVLLMEPLVKGTEWTLKDGSRRYISGTEVAIETPSGDYKAIEVTTEGSDSITKDYYAPQVGLVKTVFNTGDLEVTSSLKEIKSGAPYTQTIDIYYPNEDEKIYVEPITLTFHTGDDTKSVLKDAISAETDKESYLPLASINTKINDLTIGADNVVHVDFSKDLVSDMNLGSGYEELVLQSITNTLAGYFGVQKVEITVEGKPYESGHILMKEGETFTVNMEKVVR